MQIDATTCVTLSAAANWILTFLSVVLTWPVCTLAIAILLSKRFYQPLSTLINNLRVRWQNGEVMIGANLVSQQPSVSLQPADDQPEGELRDEVAFWKQTAQHWYLEVYLAVATKSLLYAARLNGPFTESEAWEAIGKVTHDPTEAEAIRVALTQTQLITPQADGRFSVGHSGQAYLNWRDNTGLPAPPSLDQISSMRPKFIVPIFKTPDHRSTRD